MGIKISSNFSIFKGATFNYSRFTAYLILMMHAKVFMTCSAIGYCSNKEQHPLYTCAKSRRRNGEQCLGGVFRGFCILCGPLVLQWKSIDKVFLKGVQRLVEVFPESYAKELTKICGQLALSISDLTAKLNQRPPPFESGRLLVPSCGIFYGGSMWESNPPKRD